MWLTHAIQSFIFIGVLVLSGYNDPDIHEAERYLNVLALENSSDLMRDLDRYNRCHLIQTKGDIHFRRDNHAGAIERYLESRKIAEEHNYIVDVGYIDTILRVVRARSSPKTSSVPLLLGGEEDGEDGYSSGREGGVSESEGEEETTDLTPDTASSDDSGIFEHMMKSLKTASA